MFEAVGGRRDPEAVVRHALAAVVLATLASCSGALALFGWLSWHLLRAVWALLLAVWASWFPPPDLPLVSLDVPQPVELVDWEEYREPAGPAELPLPELRAPEPRIEASLEDAAFVGESRMLLALLGTRDAGEIHDVLSGSVEGIGLGTLGAGSGVEAGALGGGMWGEGGGEQMLGAPTGDASPGGLGMPRAVTAGSTAPRLLSRIELPDPGWCDLEVRVDARGRAEVVGLPDCPPELHEVVKKEVKRASWQPASSDGEPYPSNLRLRLGG